jgi:site-specific DNA recombinase
VLFDRTAAALITQVLFDRVQDVFRGHNQPKYRKHDFAFGGLLRCAHDDCTVTAEIKKQRYVYYRCTGYRGKCSLPYFREEQLGEFGVESRLEKDDYLQGLRNRCHGK